MDPSLTPDDLHQIKRQLRAEMRLRRVGMASLAAAEAAATHLIEHFLRPDDAVAAFWSIGDELGTGPLRTRLIERGVPVALPVVVGRGEPLAFRRWRPGDEMATGAFDIREPLPSAPALAPTLIVVPLLAVDRRGYRLGYGGGYYDRTLAAWPAARTVGWCYEAQIIDAVPTEPFDRPVDAVVTERGWFATGAATAGGE